VKQAITNAFALQKIRTDPRETLNNPERGIDLIVSFPVKHRDDVGQVRSQST
jgi:hypothetical protein